MKTENRSLRTSAEMASNWAGVIEPSSFHAPSRERVVIWLDHTITAYLFKGPQLIQDARSRAGSRALLAIGLPGVYYLQRGRYPRRAERTTVSDERSNPCTRTRFCCSESSARWTAGTTRPWPPATTLRPLSRTSRSTCTDRRRSTTCGE